MYDIGQADQQVFLSMEYVDGEDLFAVPWRIGRLPSDKALVIARKICAGITRPTTKACCIATKPANIMLDGRGEVLVMDFGLAGIAHEIEDVRSGTPAYMEPEQLSGKEVTVRSDIYSPAWCWPSCSPARPPSTARHWTKSYACGRTARRIVRPRWCATWTRWSSASSHCLEADPGSPAGIGADGIGRASRRRSFAVALAAGETPSPQVVAPPAPPAGLAVCRTTVVATAAALLGLIIIFVAGARTSGIAR